MIKPGHMNTLTVIKEVPFGVYLDGGTWGEILLPKKAVPQGTMLHDHVEVFLYFDSEDRLIATTRRPYATLDKCAFLKVIDVNAVGAFLDWGLDKDLLVPKSEQQRFMEKGKSYLVYLKQDDQGRPIASSKLDHFLDKSPSQLQQHEEVQLWIAETTALGTKVVINDQHWGLVHASDLFQTLRYGQHTRGYIKTVRSDGKIDVILRKPGSDHLTELATRILTELNKQGGFLPLHDKSHALEIQNVFGESKKKFKEAIGQLYKQQKITLEATGIRLTTS